MFSKKIGLALGGGGARGAAHLGVLKVLKSMDVIPCAVAGTSAGSVLAALYAFQVPYEKMEQELRQLKVANLSGLNFGRLGLFENTLLSGLLTRLLPRDAKIEQAPIPLAIMATDLITGRSICLKEGPVVEAVLASSTVPGFYIPIEKNGMILVDGGLTENVPISPLAEMGASFTLAVDLNGQERYNKPNGVFDVLSNALDIAIDSNTRDQLKNADLVVSLDLSSYSRTNANDFDSLVAQGMRGAKEAIRSARLLFWSLRVRRFLRRLRNTIPLRVPKVIQEWWFRSTE